jgi:hypothetical protein
MTVLEKVLTFVEARGPRAVCDDCIADHLALSRRQVSAAHPSLKRKGSIRRYSGQCSGCCTSRTLTLLVQ